MRSKTTFLTPLSIARCASNLPVNTALATLLSNDGWSFTAFSLLLAATMVLVVAAAIAQEQTGPQVTAYGVGTDVVDRQLEGEADSFPEGTQVWFWTRVEGGSDGDRIRHVWIFGGEEKLEVGLTIGGSHWRTWSNKMLHPGSSGTWTVEARDDAGNVLASATFECTAPETAPE